MEQETQEEPDPSTGNTQSLRVHGRSEWNEPDASLSFDWSGTQIGFRVRGSPAEVNMLASIGDDVLAVYVDERFEGKIGPSSGNKETFLLVRDAPEGCRIRLVKLSEPNMSVPITIYGVWASPSALPDGVAPSIGPLDFTGEGPHAESTFECVGDSDTSALYNVAISDSATALDSNIEEGWPFFLAESLGVAPPMVVALSGVGVHPGPHRPESLSDYYPRLVCCRKDSQNSALRDNISAGSSGDPLCVLVLVGGNDFVTMPRDSPAAQSSFLQNFVSAHQALLRAIRHRRPSSPIVSLYGDADCCSGCQSVEEQKFISSNMQLAVLESVAGLGGAPYGFLACMVQPNIRFQCHSDWSHDMHWNPTSHQKFATGLKRALVDLALREGVQRRGEQWFPGMVNLAAMLSLSQTAAAVRASAESTSSENVSVQGLGLPDKSALHSEKDGGASASQVAGTRPQSWSALHVAAKAGHAEATALLVEDERCLEAVDSAVYATSKRVTPLHLAALEGHLSVTHALLRSQGFTPFVNACLHEENFGPMSALHVAADQGHARVAECLLHSEAFSKDLVNAVTGHGCTALHLACRAGHAEVVQLLLDEDPIVRKKPTAFVRLGGVCMAAYGGHDRILQVLTTHPAVNVPAELAYTAQPDPHYGSEPNALHGACKAGHLSAVQCILRLKGCERAVNAHNGQDKRTALHIAASEGHEDIASCLLWSGAFRAVNALDSHQRTALHVACFRCCVKLERIAMEIIHHPMFTRHNRRDCDGWTALKLAEEVKLPLVIDALRKL